MCDKALQKIEEVFLQLDIKNCAEAGKDQMKDFTHSVSATSNPTLDFLLLEGNGSNDDDIEMKVYKQENLDTKGDDLCMSLDSQPCCERRQLSSNVEAMLRSAVESLDAFVLEQHRVNASRKKLNVKLKRSRYVRQSRVENESMVGQWLGCEVAEKKKYKRLSLTSWRTYNRMLHRTQQSLKLFNMERRTYNIVH